MTIFSDKIIISVKGKGFTDITAKLNNWIKSHELKDGVLNLFVPHTSASLLIQQRSDPEVLMDLEDFFQRIIPEGENIYRHNYEGPDDMPSHIRASLLNTQTIIPIAGGTLALGPHQSVYFWEHRNNQRNREIILTMIT